jgi:hypothetical protein
VHKALPRRRYVEEGVPRRRDLSQTFADDEQHVSVANAFREVRVDADADIAGIVRMAVVE